MPAKDLLRFYGALQSIEEEEEEEEEVGKEGKGKGKKSCRKGEEYKRNVLNRAMTNHSFPRREKEEDDGIFR
ncbi:hypothetical protein M0804_011680 [Polistes exclamans]|nr:hypothetical protein M0804_011680 [Polistes exclamans]